MSHDGGGRGGDGHGDAVRPESPCTGVCTLDEATGWCRGCLRTGEEIGAWPTMSANAQWMLLRELLDRRTNIGGAPSNRGH